MDSEYADSPYEDVRLPGGRIIRVGRGSIAQEAFRSASEESLDRGTAIDTTVSWSLGRLGDLLWLTSPESRDGIFRLARRKFELAIATGQAIERMTGYELIFEIYYNGVLKPIFESWPDRMEDLTPALSFLRVALSYSGPDADIVLDAAKGYVLESVLDSDNEQKLRVADPEIAAAIDAIYPR